MAQSVSLEEMINNPQHSTKKQLRPPGSYPRRRPPKLGSKRRVCKRLSSTCPVLLTNNDNNENSTLCSLYDQSLGVSYFDQCFDQLYKIGEGSFGEVYKVRSKKNGLYYAVKITKVSFRGECDREEKINEVRNHELVPPYENIVKLISAWEQDNYVYIQMELGEGSAREYAEDEHEIPEIQLWNIFLDILLALKNLHDHNLVHLDVKPENIILFNSGICKLSDFGLLINLKDEDRMRKAVEGDSRYLANELMEGKFSKAADVFSLGISMLELASDLELPTHGQLWHNLRSGILPAPIIKNVSKEMLNIIRRMMTRDYRKRPSVKSLLKHPRFKSMMKKRREAVNSKPFEPQLHTPPRQPLQSSSIYSTPPNQGASHFYSNGFVQSTPAEGFSISNFNDVFSNYESPVNNSDEGNEAAGFISLNSITTTPYMSALALQSKSSKNILFTSAKKLNFLDDV